MPSTDPYPRAHSFTVWFCGKPDCGMHLIAHAEDKSIMCEVVMSPDQTMDTVAKCIMEMLDKGYSMALITTQ
jgi:hypothetical protein